MKEPQLALAVVVVEDEGGIVRAIENQERLWRGEPVEAPHDPLWRPGMAAGITIDQPGVSDGAMVVDLQKLDPRARYLVLYLRQEHPGKVWVPK